MTNIQETKNATSSSSEISFKLCNVLLKPLPCFSDFPELLYRVLPSFEDGTHGQVDRQLPPTQATNECASGKQELDTEAPNKQAPTNVGDALKIQGTLDFMTYFNALSVSKWKRYTNLESAYLHLEFESGAGTVSLTGINQSDVSADWLPSPNLHNASSAIPQSIKTHALGEPFTFDASSAPATLELEIPFENLLLASFVIKTEAHTILKSAYWYARVPQEEVRPIRLAIATTTFNNENYIAPNIDLFKQEILGHDEPISSASHLFVVDNGRTLDPKKFEAAGVSVIPNANVGGSGGFARGMMAALEEGDYTHVLLMDDDVSIQPESFLRTFNLLSLANDAYADASVNGAMFTLETPNMQFEDVSYLGPDGQYARIKGNLYLDNVADIAVNEKVLTEKPQTYGAWWFSCIPVKSIKEYGLPLPLFVRLDDVEYGLRTHARYMTMNGICVWHAGFGDRFRASVDVYQYLRNYLVMLATDDLPYEKIFMLRTRRAMQLYLRMMAYETAELMVEALEDYLKGPEFLQEPQGERIMKENGAKNEQLHDLQEELQEAASKYPAYAKELQSFTPNLRMLEENVHVPYWFKALRTLPYDRHLLPSFLLRKKPGTIYYGGFTLPSSDLIATSVLVAADRKGQTAHVRIMDKDRYKRIRRRWKNALTQYAKTKKTLQARYRVAREDFVTNDFWNDYLKRALEGSAANSAKRK